MPGALVSVFAEIAVALAAGVALALIGAFSILARGLGVTLVRMVHTLIRVRTTETIALQDLNKNKSPDSISLYYSEQTTNI